MKTEAERTKSNYKKNSRVPVSSGLSGTQAARRLLDGAGIQDVSIGHARGIPSDHYDPRNKTLTLIYFLVRSGESGGRRK